MKKLCSICKQEKPREEFYTVQAMCKVCSKTKVKQYRASHREQIKAGKKQPHYLNQQKKYYLKSRDRILARHKAYRKTHMAEAKALSKRYYENHRSEVNARSSAWQKTHPDQVKTSRQAFRVRHAARLREEVKQYYWRVKRRASKAINFLVAQKLLASKINHLSNQP